MQKVFLFGATGTIGENTLYVLRKFPERFKLFGISARKNIEKLKKIAEEFRVPYLVIETKEDRDRLFKELQYRPEEIFWGDEGLKEAAFLSEVDILVVGISGIKGLIPSYYGLLSGKRVTLANKEAIICGHFFLEKIKDKGELIPVDSEHSALYQLFQKTEPEEIEKIYLTASGGPFYRLSMEDLKNITPEEAVRHPNWKMGPKISVDSATLMNKGFEVIEASYLFGLPKGKIKVLIHRQSIVHALVELIDGTFFAHLTKPDMKLPILYALSFPERLNFQEVRLNFEDILTLDFEPPDFERFPCLSLAYEALEKEPLGPIVLEAADEVVVEKFLSGRIPFLKIYEYLKKVFDFFTANRSYWKRINEMEKIEELLFLHKEVREFTEKLIEKGEKG